MPAEWAAKPDVWKAQAIHATQKGKSLTDMAEALRFAFERPATFDEKAAEKFMTSAVKPALQEVSQLVDYTHEGLEAAFAGILERHGLKTKDLAQALRVALCGKPVSPGIFDTLMLVGHAEVVARLERWL
jgi:glutamyl-tRNA synthetase